MPKVNEEKNPAIQSGQPLKDKLLDAALVSSDWRPIGCAVFVGGTDPRPVAVTDLTKAMELLRPGLMRDRSKGEAAALAMRIAVEHNVHDALVAALAKTLNVMDIQEHRDDETFHLSQQAFRPMWDAAKEQAVAALALANGQVASDESGTQM